MTAPEADPPPDEASRTSSVRETSQASHSRGRRISLDAYGVKKPARATDGRDAAKVDDFGLPIKRRVSRASRTSSRAESVDEACDTTGKKDTTRGDANRVFLRRRSRSAISTGERGRSVSPPKSIDDDIPVKKKEGETSEAVDAERGRVGAPRQRSRSAQRPTTTRSRSLGDSSRVGSSPLARRGTTSSIREVNGKDNGSPEENQRSRSGTLPKILEGASVNKAGVSEWSHQALVPKKEEVVEEKEEEWQDMPAYGKYDVFDDEGRLVAKGAQDSDDEDLEVGYGGAGKGYTRVQVDDDAKSTTSLDENTNYLFKEKGTNVVDEDEEQRDPLAQMQATKELLTEGQRIAYVGVTRLAMVEMLRELEALIPGEKKGQKEVTSAIEGMKMWGQKMMVRLYAHMEIDSSGTYACCHSLKAETEKVQSR